MPQCPQCAKQLREFTRRCPTCQAELDLLVDYVGQLQTGLDRALQLTQAGELGQAMWAYLQVLEVDPDNPTARRHIAQIVTAVRQFDRVTPGRRWADRIGPLETWKPHHFAIVSGVGTALLLFAFALGFLLGGVRFPTPEPADEPVPQLPAPDQKQLGPPPAAAM